MTSIISTLCQHSLDTLQRVSSEAAEISDTVMKYDDLRTLIVQCVKNAQLPEQNSRMLDHMAKCCEGLIQSNDRAYEDWSACLTPYIESSDENQTKQIVENQCFLWG